jgi:hypothetical protein
MNKFEQPTNNVLDVDQHEPVKNKNLAMKAISESKNIDDFIQALALLKENSEVGTESYKDAVYCAGLAHTIKAGTWHFDIDLRYIDSEDIRKKLEDLQLSYRFETVKDIENLKQIIRDIGGVNGFGTDQTIELIDDAVSTNGTNLERDVLKRISKKHGFRDALMRILDKMPKAEFNLVEKEPISGPVIVDNPEEFVGTTPISEAEAKTRQTAMADKTTIDRKSGWKRWLGI